MKIKENLKMMFTNIQYKDKFKRMVKDYKVSKILIKEKNNKFYINWIYKNIY